MVHWYYSKDTVKEIDKTREEAKEFSRRVLQSLASSRVASSVPKDDYQNRLSAEIAKIKSEFPEMSRDKVRLHALQHYTGFGEEATLSLHPRI